MERIQCSRPVVHKEKNWYVFGAGRLLYSIVPKGKWDIKKGGGEKMQTIYIYIKVDA